MRSHLIATLILACSTLAGFAQGTSQRYGTSAQASDSLRSILASRTFTLEEEYRGDWGDHSQTFRFTAGDASITVQWKDPVCGKNLEVRLPLNELDRLADLFLECSSRIDSSSTMSTEHISYLFKNKETLYAIDDRYTMECYEDFNAWKAMLLATWNKEEKE